MSLFSLHNKIAFITGSTQGLGIEMARAMAQAGAFVILHGRRQEALDNAVNTLKAEGFELDAVLFDINDTQARQSTIEALYQKYGRIDILVNNAGIRARQASTKLSLTEVEQVLATNITSCIEVTRLIAPKMAENKWGRIINISSIQAHISKSTDFIYPISKAGLEAMTRAFALEYGRYNVLCNAIAPGAFLTEFNEKALNREDRIESMQKRNPLKRWGEPKEIAGPAVFLASDACSYINGQTIIMDGGFTISFDD